LLTRKTLLVDYEVGFPKTIKFHSIVLKSQFSLIPGMAGEKEVHGNAKGWKEGSPKSTTFLNCEFYNVLTCAAVMHSIQ